MLQASRSVRFAMLALLLGIAGCTGGAGESKGGATPPENVSEAEPEGVGGTSNQ
jgi:hypothetical protein